MEFTKWKCLNRLLFYFISSHSKTEAFCSTYNVDLFCVVYSAIDKSSFKAAEKMLHYLKDNEMLLTRGAILVGNKTDLERHREVTRQGESGLLCFHLIIIALVPFSSRDYDKWRLPVNLITCLLFIQERRNSHFS